MAGPAQSLWILEIVRGWRRSAATVSIGPWRGLSPAEWEAVEADALSLLLPGLDSPIAVRRNHSLAALGTYQTRIRVWLSHFLAVLRYIY